MKKALKRMLSLFLAITLIAVVPVSTNAASNASKAKAKYEAYIEKNKSGIYQYKIVDIDKNKIPELIVIRYDKAKTYVYSYDTKKKAMVAVKTVSYGRGYGAWYNTSKHYVTISKGSTTDFTYTVYKIKGKKASKVTYFSGSYNVKTGKWKYKYKKKSISTAKFKSYYKKYVTNYKTLDYVN